MNEQIDVFCESIMIDVTLQNFSFTRKRVSFDTFDADPYTRMNDEKGFDLFENFAQVKSFINGIA